jgi:predicted amidohydrolase
MSLAEVVARSTVTPAKTIGRYPEVGTLGVGRGADITVLEEQTGVFAFKDSWPAKRLGTKRLDCVYTIRAGKVVYERGPGAPADADTTIYDLLLKHARLGGRTEEVDIGIIGNRVEKIGRGLKAAHARVIAEVEGYQVTPAALAAGGMADLQVRDGDRVILTVRNGRVIRDDAGLTIPDVTRAGPYTNFK